VSSTNWGAGIEAADPTASGTTVVDDASTDGDASPPPPHALSSKEQAVAETARRRPTQEKESWIRFMAGETIGRFPKSA
jgi:hypothetical protein